MTVPAASNVRSAFAPRRLSVALSDSLTRYASPSTPVTPASSPAAAFQTPRVASVRANTPAIAPDGANVSGRFVNGFVARTGGRKKAACCASGLEGGSAAVSAASPLLAAVAGGVNDASGGATMRDARRERQ